MTAPVPDNTTAILNELVSEWRLVWESAGEPESNGEDSA